MSSIDTSSERTQSEGSRTGIARVDREHQWRTRLAIATSTFIVVMALTGLSMWLLPFSVLNQIQVMVHTTIGVVLLLPVSWYTLRHWLVYRRHLMSHEAERTKDAEELIDVVRAYLK